MKKAFYFLMLLLYVLGIVGGFGYLVYYGQYVICAGIAGCGYMGWFKAKEYLKKLTE
jgi:hypothetical protein